MNGNVPRKRNGRRRCRCNAICRRGQEVRRVLRSGDFDQARKLIRSLLDDLAQAKEDAAMLRWKAERAK